MATAKGKPGATPVRIKNSRGVHTTVWRNGYRDEPTLRDRIGGWVSGRNTQPKPNTPRGKFSRIIGAIAGTYYEPPAPPRPVAERYAAHLDSKPSTELRPDRARDQAALYNQMRERRLSQGRDPDTGRDPATGLDEWDCYVDDNPYDPRTGELKFGRKLKHIENGEEWSPEGFLRNGDYAGKNGVSPGRNRFGYDARGFKGAPDFTFAGTGTPFTPDLPGKPGSGVNVDGRTRAEVHATETELSENPAMLAEMVRQASALPNWR